MFPLLIEKFSLEEQASLVWQFLCSIPVNMMAVFLPWLSASISPDESLDLRKCLGKIVPQEKLLQKVWLSTSVLVHSFQFPSIVEVLVTPPTIFSWSWGFN